MSKNIELAGTVTIGPKGQVVIPVEVREKMGISPGDKLVALYLPEKKAVGFVTESAIQNIIERMGNHIAALRNGLGKK